MAVHLHPQSPLITDAELHVGLVAEALRQRDAQMLCITRTGLVFVVTGETILHPRDAADLSDYLTPEPTQS